MMIELNKAVVPGQVVCLTRARVVPNPNKAAAGSAGGRLRNLVNVVGKGKLLVASHTPTPTPIQRRRRSCPLMATSHPNADIANNICPLIDQKINMCHLISSSVDPCLDLFNNSLRPSFMDTNNCLKYLKQLLPLAWSHNPITTLKLIFNVHFQNFTYRKFDTALFWLHQSHPKTLLRNLDSIADLTQGWGLDTLVNILHHILVGKLGGQENEDAAAHLHLHPERYDRDPDYRLLHDRVIDIFVERLKSDINKMNQHKLKMKPSDYTTDSKDEFSDDGEDKIDAGVLVSEAAQCCTFDCYTYRSIFLHESIARRLFPPESDLSEEWARLKKESLVPLTNYYQRQNSNIQGDCVVKKYLEAVKAGGGGNLRGGIIKPDALLPNEILKYVEDEDVGEAAELQWKAMVEDIKQQHQKQGEGLGKLKNWLVVGHSRVGYSDKLYCDEDYAKMGLELLVSEVSEEPWKGKMIKNSGGKHQLDLIQGHDLKSKLEFTKRRYENNRRENIMWRPVTPVKVCDILEVFDLIVEVGVNENLKAEQMTKKVIVFTSLRPPNNSYWEIEYELLRSKFEEIRSMYKDKGYGDEAVPHILFWDVCKSYHSPSFWICTQHPGFTRLSAPSDHFFKSFLENGGEIRLHHVMEAVIGHKEYQALCVVD